MHLESWDAAKEGVSLTSRRSSDARAEQWTSFFEHGTGTLVLAEVEGDVVGFVAWGPSRDDDRRGEREVYTLYVDPQRWGEGVGSALMEQVPAGEIVSLWVAEGNTRARRFYAGRGFSPDGAKEAGHHVPVIRVVCRVSGASPAAGGPLVE